MSQSRQIGSRVTPLEHTAIGALSGVLEVCVMQPTVAIKNALQEGRPVPRNPLHLYRGLLMNAASIAPITAVQFGAMRAYDQFYREYTGWKMTGASTLLLSGAAGATSSLAATPTELVVIQQQRSGRSLLRELSHFSRTYPSHRFFRGLTPCTAREFLYAMGYLGVLPVLHDHLDSMPSMQSVPDGVRTIIAGVTAGVMSALATQPFDTLKTRMQAFVDPHTHPQYATTLSTFKQVVSEGGITRLWAGLLPRGTRVIAAALLLTVFRKFFVTMLDDYKEIRAAAVAAQVRLQRQPSPDGRN